MSEPTEGKNAPAMAGHRAVVEALNVLVQEFGELPAPYFNAHALQSPAVGLLADSPEAFEQWRVALKIEPSAVTLHGYGESVWLHATTTFRGVKLDLSGHGLPLTVEQAASSPDAEQVSA